MDPAKLSDKELAKPEGRQDDRCHRKEGSSRPRRMSGTMHYTPVYGTYRRTP